MHELRHAGAGPRFFGGHMDSDLTRKSLPRVPRVTVRAAEQV